MAQRQVNIRLPEEDVVYLEAGAFLSATSMPEMVRGLLLDHVQSLRKRDRVRQLVLLREEEQAERDGVLTSLPARAAAEDPK